MGIIKIKHRYTCKTLFETEAEDIKECVEKAVEDGAYLVGANLVGANLRGANLVGAYLVDANLVGAYLVGANLVGANLRGANLGGAYLVDANLVGANLRGANLGGANLRGANLGGANLRGANLVGADLVGVNLGGAYLGGADIRGDITIQKPLLFIDSTRYQIIIYDQHMQIGCELHSVEDWWKYDYRRIIEMDGKRALTWWRKWKPILKGICQAELRGC